MIKSVKREEANRQYQDLPIRYVRVLEKAFKECDCCGDCVRACPCIELSELKRSSAKEICKAAKLGLRRGKITEALIERAFACSRCGICRDICPKGIDVYDLQQALRCQIVAEKRRNVSLHLIRAETRVFDDYDVDDILSCLQVNADKRPWVTELSEIIPKKKTVLFLGCSTRRYMDKIHTLLDILRLLNVEPVVLAGGKVCCGARSQSIGNLREADEQGYRLVSQLTEYGAEEVLVICPACLHMLMKEIPQVTEVRFEVKHVFETVVEKVDHLHFKHSIKKKATYHDPCKLGRMCGDYHSARTLLRVVPGLSLVEMKMAREKASCCGGTAWRYNQGLANELRKTAMNSAKETGAETVITACNLCFAMFHAASKEFLFTITDVLTVLGKSLGIEYENKLMKYRDYHNPERVILEAREYIEASPYSVEEVRTVLKQIMP